MGENQKNKIHPLAYFCLVLGVIGMLPAVFFLTIFTIPVFCAFVFGYFNYKKEESSATICAWAIVLSSFVPFIWSMFLGF